jgi:predicted secreted protein
MASRPDSTCATRSKHNKASQRLLVRVALDDIEVVLDVIDDVVSLTGYIEQSGNDDAILGQEC